MARKSNKTSHVLHLLAGEEPVPEAPKEQAPDPEAADPKPAEQPEAAPSPDTPNISIISTGNGEGDPLADLIKEQLEETFPEEILTPAAEPPVLENEPEMTPKTADGIDPQTDISDHLDQTQKETQQPNADGPLSPQTDTADDLTPPQDDSASLSAKSPAKLTDAPSHPTDGAVLSDPKPQTDVFGDENASADNSDATAEPVSANLPTEKPQPEESAETHSSTEPSDNSPTAENASETVSAPTDAAQPNTDPAEPPKTNLDSVLDPAKEEESRNYRFVNVMEYVIKDIVRDYMKKFNMCTCERCVVDTTALALTYSHAKYIVVDKHTVSPLLNFYSSRYMGDVTVELTKACIQVKENPRH